MKPKQNPNFLRHIMEVSDHIRSQRIEAPIGRADLAQRCYAYLVTGVTSAARKQPDLKVVA